MEAEGEKDGLFLSEIQRHVCGPGKNLECLVFGKKSLRSASALAGQRSHQLGGCSFAIGLGARLTQHFPPAHVHRWEHSHASIQRLLNPITPGDHLSCGLRGYLFGLGRKWTQLWAFRIQPVLQGRTSVQWEGLVGGPWLGQTGCSVDRHTHESAEGRLGEHTGAKEHFSHQDVPMNHLEVLSDCRF